MPRAMHILMILAFATAACPAPAKGARHREAMRALKEECATKTGAQLGGKRYTGSPAVMAAWRSCIGG